MAKRLRTPPWVAIPAVAVIYGTVDIALPVLLSRVGVRVGWNDGPSPANLAGIVLVVVGGGVIAWSATAHGSAWRACDWRIVKYDREHLLTPDYLVTAGPYRFTRNPLYVGDIVMWVGWAVVFGSPAIAVVLGALIVGLQIGVRLEERGLYRQFGDAWRQYAATTPRFIGRHHSVGERTAR